MVSRLDPTTRIGQSKHWGKLVTGDHDMSQIRSKCTRQPKEKHDIEIHVTNKDQSLSTVGNSQYARHTNIIDFIFGNASFTSVVYMQTMACLLPEINNRKSISALLPSIMMCRRHRLSSAVLRGTLSDAVMVLG